MEKIKKYRINWNTVLLILNVIAFFVSIWIVFGILPFIDSNFDAWKIRRVNDFLVALCIGINVSSLVYLLTTYLPNRKKQRFVRKHIIGTLKLMALCMQRIFAYLYWKENPFLDKQIVNTLKINEEYITQISSLSKKKIERYWCGQPADSTNLTNLSGSTELGIIHEYTSKIETFSDKVINNILFVNEKQELIELLFEIKSLNVISNVKTLYKNKNISMSIPNLGQEFIKLHQSYLKLLNYVDVEDIRVMGKIDKAHIPFVLT